MQSGGMRFIDGRASGGGEGVVLDWVELRCGLLKLGVFLRGKRGGGWVFLNGLTAGWGGGGEKV